MKKQTKTLAVILLLSVLLGSVCMFTACDLFGGLFGGSIDAPTSIAYDGEVVTWNSVNGAGSYILRIGNEEKKCVSNRYPYRTNNQFTVSVKAVSADNNSVMSEEISKTFSPLATVSQLYVSEQCVVSWDDVSGATAYVVKTRLDNGNAQTETVYTPYYDKVPVGKLQIQVKAVVEGDDSYFSSFCDAKQITKLGVVDQKTIGYDGVSITFGGVSGAKSYDVYVDGMLYSEGITERRVLYTANEDNFFVSIQARGDNKVVFDGAASPEKNFIFLQNVTNLRVEEGKMVWDEVEGATSYSIKINGQTVDNLSKAEYDGAYLREGTRLDISVKPVSSDGTYFSNYCQVHSFYLLPAPTIRWNADLSLEGGENSMIWNAIDGATGYEVLVEEPDGTKNVLTYGQSQQNFAYNYDLVGTYKLYIKATANEAIDNTYSSKYSQPITVIRPAPLEKGGNEFIKSSAYDLSKGFTVTPKVSSGDCTYALYKNGTQIQTGSTSQFYVTNITDEQGVEGQEYMYSIKKIGNVRVINGQYVVTLNSKETLDFKITVLAVPQNVYMSGYTIQYDSVVGASYGYAITGVASNPVVEYNLSRDLSPDLKAGNYNMQVCAAGNGADILPSTYSAILPIHRLEAPTNIRIDTDLAANGILKYDVESYAEGIELYFNNTLVMSPASVVENMNDNIQTTGTSVMMIATANKYGDNGIYYMSSVKSPSKQFIKLSAPSQLKFDNTHLYWNQNGISQAATGKVTYKIYNDKEILFSAEQNDRSVDLSNLAGGMTYSFYVRAIGDGETYINSDLSDLATIYKLRTPKVVKEDGKYVWDSVSSASSYSVSVDGVIYSKEIHVSGTENQFDPRVAFTKIGVYTVEVTAVGDGGINTINSSPAQLQQQTKQLTKPDFALSYDKPYYDEEGNIVATITQQSPYATGYRYMFNNITREVLGEASLSYSYNPNATGVYRVSISAIGGSFDNDGIYCLDSQVQGGDSYVMTLLPEINPSAIVLDADGRMSWGRGIEGADGYEIEIFFNGSAVGHTVYVDRADFDVNDYVATNEPDGITRYSKVTSIRINIRVIGKNASQKVSSKLTSKEWLSTRV